MTDSTNIESLDDIPDAESIESLRGRARDDGESVVVRYPAPDGERKRLVVSPRGTCVVLNDVSEETFNSSVDASEIAAALREA